MGEISSRKVMELSYELLVIVITFAVFPHTGSSQGSAKVYYVHRAEKTTQQTSSSPVFVLELNDNTFYTYAFPYDIAGCLCITTGCYSRKDSVLSLDVDTSVVMSLNTGRLVSMSVNCDSSRIAIMKDDQSGITMYGVPNVNKRMQAHEVGINASRLVLTYKYNLAEALRPFGPELEWAKIYLRGSPEIEIQICDR